MPDGAGDQVFKQLEGGQANQGNFVVIKDEDEKKCQASTSQEDRNIDTGAMTTPKLDNCTEAVHLP